MPWMLREGEVLAAIEVASGRHERRRGLLGRDGIEGALLLAPARSVHSLGMRFALDVAYCAGGPSDSLVVLDTLTMRQWRIGRPRWRASCVIEAQAGAFERWRLRAGDSLEIR